MAYCGRWGWESHLPRRDVAGPAVKGRRCTCWAALLLGATSSILTNRCQWHTRRPLGALRPAFLRGLSHLPLSCFTERSG